MRTKNPLSFFLLAAFLCASSAAQQTDKTSTPETQNDVADSQPLPLPAPVSGQGPSLAFNSELGDTNFLVGGVSLAATFDDNALNTTTNPVSDTAYSILPHIALDQSRGRAKWSLDYAGGLTVNQRLTNRNQGSHSVGFESEYRAAPHLTFRLRDRFVDTTSFFALDSNAPVASSGGILQRPNDTVITPLARQLGNFTEAEVEYQAGAGTLVGANGSFYFNNYSDESNGSTTTPGLMNTQSQQAQAFFSHRFTTRNWSGVTYRFQRLGFEGGTDTTFAHSVLFFHTVYLKPNLTFSVFAGPEYSETSAQSVSTQVQLPLILVTSTAVDRQMWSAAGGASFAWQGEHTSLHTDFVRRISDGGGLLGAVRVNSVDAEVRHQLGRRSSVQLGAGYAMNDSIDFASAPGASIRSVSGRIGFDHQLGNNLFVDINYGRDNQRQSSTGANESLTNHNRAWISLSYNFSRPLGR